MSEILGAENIDQLIEEREASWKSWWWFNYKGFVCEKVPHRLWHHYGHEQSLWVRVQIPDAVDCPEATPLNRYATLSSASPGYLLLVPGVHSRGGCSQSMAILENRRTQPFGILVPAFNFFKASYSIFIDIDWYFGLCLIYVRLTLF